MSTSNLQTQIAEQIAQDLVGHVAMPGVTAYVVEGINEYFGTEFEDTDALVEFAQEHNAEIAECGCCGWYVDYVDYCEDLTEWACEDCYIWEDD